MIKRTLTLIPSAFNHKAMGDISNFIPFYKEQFSVVVISDLYDDDLVDIDGVKYIKARTSLSDYYIYTSDYIIDAGSVNRHSKVWQGQKRISVWHGIPYKKMFIDLDEKHISSALNYQNGYDLMVSPSKFYTEKFLNNSMMYNREVLEIGSSRCDSLFISANKKESIRNDLGINFNEKIVLYAPTFRKSGDFVIPFDTKKIIDKFGKEYRLIVKGHYLNEIKNYDSNIIDATNYSNVNELISIADVLITDYSSLFFDFSVVNNNVIFFQYDKKEYKNERGFMFDLEDYVDSKLICETEKELLGAIELIVSRNSFKNILKDVFYPHANGEDTKRIVREINLDDKKRTHKDIIFLVNDLNNIGGIHTFVSSLSKLFKSRFDCRIKMISLREFNDGYTEFNRFCDSNIDLPLSFERHKGAVKSILTNTDGYIISTQFSAHLKLQEYIGEDANCLLMFHGDIKDVINKTIYHWHYDSLTNKSAYNYKKLLLLSESNKLLLESEKVEPLNDIVDYVYNPYFSSLSNCYKQSGVFVSVTRLDHDKNIFDLLDIFSHENIDPRFTLEVYGDGPLFSELNEAIINRNLSNKIFLKGYESDKNIIFKDKQGFIFTPVSEGFPYVVLESFDHGIPVYSYDSFTSVNDIINNNVGRVVKYKDIDSYVETLNEAIYFNYSSFVAHISNFSPELTLNKWLAIFEDCKYLNPVLIGGDSKLDKKRSINKILKIKIKSFYKKLSKTNKVHVRSLYSQLCEIKSLCKWSKEKPLVSIIMPFYNNSSTVEAAVSSIYKQRYKNVEILIINDGSIYNEKPLLKKYKKVRYFYQENSGPGLARNLGVDNAKGKYLFYLDSDDTMPRATLTALVDYAETHNLGMVMGKKSRIKFKNKKDRHVWMPSIYKKNHISERSERFKLLSEVTSTGILFKISDLKSSGIRWESGLYEDKVYSLKTYNHFERIGILNHFTYNWFVYGENTSISTSINLDNFKERYFRLLEIWCLLDEKGKFIYYHQIISHDFKIYINNYQCIDEVDRFKLYSLMREFLVDNEQYFYRKNVVNIINLEVVTAIFDDDFERFDKISCTFSNHYQSLHR